MSKLPHVIATLTKADLEEVIGQNAARLSDDDLAYFAEELAELYFAGDFTHAIRDVWERKFAHTHGPAKEEGSA